MTLEFSTSPDTDELRKARGAFFTPEKVADYVTRWAVRSPTDLVLEPSCGEASFLIAAAKRLKELGGTGRLGDGNLQLHGVELHGDSSASARANVSSVGFESSITTGDFFLEKPDGTFDAVIGNPPYIRYQDFSGEARARSRAAALGAGVNLPALASSWAAFTIHAALFLRPGGRMGLVIPAELLSVNYAAGVRRFLFEHFAGVSLVMFEERVFPGVLEEVVLVLADGYALGSSDHASIYQVQSPDDLAGDFDGHIWKPINPEGKWTASLLGGPALKAYDDALSSERYVSLEEWGDTTLGMVTGNNKFFALSPLRVNELGLSRTDVVPLSPPGSKHLRVLDTTSRQLKKLGEAGSATWLFRPQGAPSEAAQKYIDAGHTSGVDTAYKCRVRTPWWRVPLIRPADLFLTYMNSDTPRLTTNAARAHHLNSVHGVYLKDSIRDLGLELLPLASVNSVTLLGAEVVGRAYGGGMLKLEPREADALPVPSPSLVAAAAPNLREIRKEVQDHLTRGELLKAAALVDSALAEARGISSFKDLDVAELRRSRASLAARRVARGPNARKS